MHFLIKSMTRVFLSIFALLCLAGCRGNLWGYLEEEPAISKVAGDYQLDFNESQERLQKMGYKNFSARLTLGADGTFTARDIPACCVHGWDESTYPFSGGHYSLSGTWKIAKTNAIYVVKLSLTTAKMTEPGTPAADLGDRKAPDALELHLLEGDPLLLGFHIFNGDFDDIIFSRVPE